jgi:hypothetical protein
MFFLAGCLGRTIRFTSALPAYRTLGNDRWFGRFFIGEIVRRSEGFQRFIDSAAKH